MVISQDESAGTGRVLYEIGKVSVASAWHAAGAVPHQGNWRERMLADLARMAEDVFADAVIRVDYAVDAVALADEGRVSLQRIIATGVAVKLCCAA